MPRWWLIGFYLSVVFAVSYLVLYPGLGSFQGILGWSTIRQWHAQHDEASALQEQELGRFDGQTLEQLRADKDALKVARNLFAANCAACHGSDARGAKGFPNLASPNLSWGSSEAAIVETISHGRIGVMPAWQDALGTQGVDAVARYVLTLSSPAKTADVSDGKATFETMCAACHGADGKGNPLLGAPNLTDDVWIYGGSPETVRETIANGRNNQMPAHLERLGVRKIRLLAAYVLSLSPAHGEPDGHPSDAAH